MPSTIAERLRDYNQEHLLQNWDELSSRLQHSLSRQIEEIDFELLERLVRGYQSGETLRRDTIRPANAKPPEHVIRLPRTPTEAREQSEAALRGEELLRAGRVGVILVAGGQGTRLGFEHPKGMYEIGPVSQKSLFQLLAEQLLARTRRAKVAIPYYIMTSDVTHSATVEYFARHDHFGLNPRDVYFFQQGTMPAVDCRTGRLLLSAPGQLSTSPDGHGGMLQALSRAGLLNDMRQRGVDYLYYHQVDNPLAIVCDPAFLGFHADRQSDISTKVVRKTAPEEKMGVVVNLEGQTRIIEYSDLPLDIASRKTADGELELWAGNTAIHVFSRDFLERIVRDRLELPFHLAHKKVPYLDDTQTLVEPDEPNAYKFERFIFDVLPHAKRALVVEADRTREFNPVKNASGANSPADVRSSLIQLFSEWLRAAGVNVTKGSLVEISPLFALDAKELAAKIPADFQCRSPVYLEAPGNPG